MNLELQFTGSAENALLIRDAIAEDELIEVAERPDERPGQVAGTEVLVAYGLVVLSSHVAFAVTSLAYRLRQRFRPAMVLDVTSDTPVLTILEDAPGLRGELIVKTREGEEVEVFTGGSSEETASVVEGLIRHLDG